MTPQIAGFVTRADLDLRPPKSWSGNIRPDLGGVALHYGGPPTRILNHNGCLRTWRGWQAFHMDPKPQGRGWADIAYSVGVCDHGYVLAGRGYGRRTAAQGTDDGNDRFLAVCWLGGEGELPTGPAVEAIAWAVHEFRQQGAGLLVKPHKWFHDTGCPGGALESVARSLDGRRIDTPEPPDPPATADEEAVMRLYLVDHGDGRWSRAFLRPTGTIVPIKSNAQAEALLKGGIPQTTLTKAEFTAFEAALGEVL